MFVAIINYKYGLYSSKFEAERALASYILKKYSEISNELKEYFWREDYASFLSLWNKRDYIYAGDYAVIKPVVLNHPIKNV